MNWLSIGTYSIHGNIGAILQKAWENGCFYIDTAPNYRGGCAQLEICKTIMRAEREGMAYTKSIKVSTKIGFLDQSQQQTLLEQQVIRAVDTYHGNNISASYVAYQLEKNFQELGRSSLEYIFLHNPETHRGHKNKKEFQEDIKNAFIILEKYAELGKIRGYGIAAWDGFGTKDQVAAFSVKELEKLAYEINGSKHHFNCIQLPVNLAKPDYVIQSVLEGRGPLREAQELGIAVHVSAPFYGGRLIHAISPELCQFIQEGSSPSQAALIFAKSHPGVHRVLTSPSTIDQLHQTLETEKYEGLPLEKLRELLQYLAD